MELQIDVNKFYSLALLWESCFHRKFPDLNDFHFARLCRKAYTLYSNDDATDEMRAFIYLQDGIVHLYVTDLEYHDLCLTWRYNDLF